jgi:SAM-dependent methyltransferase
MIESSSGGTLEEPSLSTSYRESHLEKGQDYHAKFQSYPHRAMLWRKEQAVLEDMMRRLFANRPPAHLDFACGTGRILGLLAPWCRASTGVDISASMLDVARETAPSAELIEADITGNDVLGERRFELVTSFRFFRNAEDQLRLAAFRAMLTHLADDGYLVFNNHESRDALSQRVRGWLGLPAVGKTRAEVHAFTRSLGLEIVEEHAMGILPMSESRMLRPVALAEAAESLAEALPGSAAIAQNVIFVCRRANAG